MQSEWISSTCKLLTIVRGIYHKAQYRDIPCVAKFVLQFPVHQEFSSMLYILAGHLPGQIPAYCVYAWNFNLVGAYM